MLRRLFHVCAVDAQRAQKGGLTHTIWNSFTKEAGLKVNAKGIKKDRRRESGFWEDWSEELSMLDLQVCTTSEGLPRWQSCKEPTCHHRRCEFDLWVRKIPWRRKWQPTPVFLPEKSYGQRRLVGYSL